MPDNEFRNMNAMFGYDEWNDEMIELYNKYSLVRELNHDLMKRCPVYAMYALSEYLKRKKTDIECDLRATIDEIYIKAGRDPMMFAQAHMEAERVTYDTLKPVIEDMMTARMYFVIAMHKSRAEYRDYLSKKEEMFKARKTK